MANIEKINKSLQDIGVILMASDRVLKNPSSSLEEELSKQSLSGKHLATILGATGVKSFAASTGASTLSTGIATLIGATVATATGLTVSLMAPRSTLNLSNKKMERFLQLQSSMPAGVGPVRWAIGSAILLLGVGAIYKKYKATKRAQQVKERLKNEIIRKQQAIIDKLKREKELNQREFNNLKETLFVLEELFKQMNKTA